MFEVCVYTNGRAVEMVKWCNDNTPDYDSTLHTDSEEDNNQYEVIGPVMRAFIVDTTYGAYSVPYKTSPIKKIIGDQFGEQHFYFEDENDAVMFSLMFSENLIR